MVTITILVKNFLPLKYGLDKGYASVLENTIFIRTPTTVTKIEFFNPLIASPVLKIYWYAFMEIVRGNRKNARSVNSRSVAKDPATIYTNGSSVINAKAPTNI
jgi:hypothetical protein